MNFGAWACEGHFSKAKFIRQKCYIEMIDDKIKITCAGLPQNCYDFVTWENFKTGFTCSGKLTYTHVKRWNYTKGNRLHDKRREVKKKHSGFLKYRIV